MNELELKAMQDAQNYVNSNKANEKSVKFLSANADSKRDQFNNPDEIDIDENSSNDDIEIEERAAPDFIKDNL